MNSETLERLLLDRSLGALSPDSRTLLDAYLAQHPSAAARGGELEATVALARMALDSRADAAPAAAASAADRGFDTAQGLPPFPRDRLRAAEWAAKRPGRTAGLRRLAVRSTALAACVVFGVVLGGWRTRSPSAPLAGITLTHAESGNGGDGAVGVEPAEQTRQEPGGIWSRQRLYREAALREAAARAPAREWIWTSPLQKPRLERAL